ncbi:MAG: glycosyltransferase family 4 protein [Nitrososphaeria archaeon]
MFMLSITINTQTPPIKLNLTYQQLIEKYGNIDIPVNLEQLEESDYQVSVGGVSRMLVQFTNYFKLLPTWVSLGPGYPETAVYKNIKIRYVDLDPENLKKFTKFKEGFYNQIHKVSEYNFNAQDYLSYTIYNWKSAEALIKEFEDTDVYFINDFQQLQVGGIIGPSAPAIFWYHIPLIPENINQQLRTFLRKSFDGFDEVILSTKRDLEGYIRLGAGVTAKQVYPFIDHNSLKEPRESDIRKVLDKLNLKQDEKKILVVGRMDPIKSQDLAISAIKNVGAKLILVGDGSFTGSTLARGKSSGWREYLNRRAKEEGVEDKVIFAGYLNEEELFAIYKASDVVVLPSKLEGFGLTVCEGWRYRKPAVVSSGAGVSELILDGVNGYKFEAGDVLSLSDAIKKALSAKKEIGELGFETMLQWCSLKASSERLMEIIEDAYKIYQKTPKP